MNENKVPAELVINALQHQIQDYSIRLANCMATNEQLYRENEELKKECAAKVEKTGE